MKHFILFALAVCLYGQGVNPLVFKKINPPSGGGTVTTYGNNEAAFTNETSVVIDHNLGTTAVIVQCRDASDVVIGWNTMTVNTANRVTVTFDPAASGKCVVNGAKTVINGPAVRGTLTNAGAVPMVKAAGEVEESPITCTGGNCSIPTTLLAGTVAAPLTERGVITDLDFRTPNLIQHSEDITQSAWNKWGGGTGSELVAMAAPAGATLVSHFLTDNGAVDQYISTKPTMTYRVQFMAKNNTGAGAWYAIYNTDTGDLIVPKTSYFASIADWALVSFTFDTPVNCKKATIRPVDSNGANAVDLYITSIRVFEDTPAQDYTRTGALVAADGSGAGQVATYGDGTVGATRPRLNYQSAQFDGAGTYASLTLADTNTRAFTVETILRRPYPGTNAENGHPAFESSGGYAWALYGAANPTAIYFANGSFAPKIKGTFASGSVDATAATGDAYWHAYTYTYDGQWVRFYKDGTLAYAAPATGAITQGDQTWVLGAATAAANFSWVQIAKARYCNRALSSAEVAARFQSLSTSTDLQASGIYFLRRQILFDGDSQTAGATDERNSYPSQFAPSYTQPLDWENLGWPGATVDNLTTRATTFIDPFYNASRPKNVLVLWAGTNNLYNGDTGASANGKVVAYAQARSAVGWKVVMLTTLPRSDAGISANYEVDRTALNAALRTNCGVGAGATLLHTNAGGGKAYACKESSDYDALVDIAADTRVGDAGDEADVTYYNADVIHLNTAGLGIVADLVYRAVSPSLLPTP